MCFCPFGARCFYFDTSSDVIVGLYLSATRR